jgi:hypothetical protein
LEGVLAYFGHLIMVKECSSGVQNPDFGEMKEKCLTLDKGWLYTNNFLVFSKFDKMFIYSRLMAKVNRLLFISIKLRDPASLEHLLQHYKMPILGQNSLPNHEF